MSDNEGLRPTNAEERARADATDRLRNELAEKAKALGVLLQDGLAQVVRETFDNEEDAAVMKNGIDAAVSFVKNTHRTRWPATVISDTDTVGERLVRTMGLSLIDVPEVVMCFQLEEADVAMGILKDLITMAMDDPEEARRKIFPGRRVYAYRFGRKYYMHCALNDRCGCDICQSQDEDTSGLKAEGAPVWDAVSLFVPDFRAVQIVLLPPEPDAPAVNPPNGPRCSQCNAQLSAQQYQRCPCQAVQYCSRECQKKHWRVHKTMCARHASIQQQLRKGNLQCGVQLV